MLFFATIVIYVVVLLGVGVWKSRTTKTQDDFMVAGRTVSTWFLVGTLICTWIGSGSLFGGAGLAFREDRKSTRLNSSHGYISYAVFCLKKKTNKPDRPRCTHLDAPPAL